MPTPCAGALGNFRTSSFINGCDYTRYGMTLGVFWCRYWVVWNRWGACLGLRGAVVCSVWSWGWWHRCWTEAEGDVRDIFWWKNSSNKFEIKIVGKKRYEVRALASGEQSCVVSGHGDGVQGTRQVQSHVIPRRVPMQWTAMGDFTLWVRLHPVWNDARNGILAEVLRCLK